MDGWMDGFGVWHGVRVRVRGFVSVWRWKAWEDWAVKLNELAQLCCLLSIAESKSVKKLLT